jgi:hypothetical protein
MSTPLKLSLFVLLFPALGFGQPPAQDPLAELARAHADAAIQLRASPRAAAYLIRLHGLIDEIEDVSLLAQTYSAFLIGPGADPLAKDVARMLMLEVEQSRGRLSSADENRRRLGYIQDFFVIGGFDNEGKAGCDRNFGPESEIDLKATYPAKGQTASWQQLSAKALDGYVDLSTPLRPNREVVAYALTYLESPKDGTATLGIGTSGAFRLWVNGKLSTRSDAYHSPRPDQAKVKVPLKKGHNAVLLKVCQQSGP